MRARVSIKLQWTFHTNYSTCNDQDIYYNTTTNHNFTIAFDALFINAFIQIKFDY